MSRAKSIFLGSLREPSPDERRAYVERACDGDPELERHVMALLAAHEEWGERPPLPEEEVGAAVGPYRLVEEIGRGGFGVVFLAEQTEPVRRRVAVKLIKPGMDSREVLARFEAERQALALMDHPAIARIFDAGTTAGGRPYFAMEYVDGVPLTEHCERASLPLHERLDLFVRVCRAVQHAHQKGVIHRDLKPSNVLVETRDGAAHPRVIDFGVAKAIETKLTDESFHTRSAQMIGTPQYMSPEQAELGALDVDTRTDVYSLGVLLYELLTGTTPFPRDRLREAGFDELRRILREEDPPTPSGRLLRGRGRARDPDTRGRAHRVHGELDWIAMKALEKDRARRYESASALADDVERFLRDEPVEAGPPSRSYRMRKFVRRHRATIGALAVVGVAVLVAVGALAGTFGWTLRERAERRARIARELDAAWREATRLRSEAIEAAGDPAKWEGRLTAAMAALKGVDPLLDGPDEEVEAGARERVRALRATLQADERDRRLLARLERIYLEKKCKYSGGPKHEYHVYPEAVAAYREAFAECGIRARASTPPEVAAALADREPPVRARFVAAMDDWLMLAERPQVPEPDAAWLHRVLAVVNPTGWRADVRAARARGDRAALEALAVRPEVVDQPVPIVRALGQALQRVGARAEAIDLFRRAQRKHPADFWINMELFIALADERSPDALRWGGIALALRPTPGAHRSLGITLGEQGYYEEAAEQYERAAELEPDVAVVQFDLGYWSSRAGKPEKAVAAYRRGLDLDPAMKRVRANLGHELTKLKRYDEAIRVLRDGVEFDPDDAVAHLNLGVALYETGREGAEEMFRRARELDSEDARPHDYLGLIAYGRGDLDEALRHFRRADQLAPGRALYLNHIGLALAGKGEVDAALAAMDRAVELDPKDGRLRLNRGQVLLQGNDVDGALAAFREGVALSPEVAVGHFLVGQAHYARGELTEALASFRKAVDRDSMLADAHNLMGLIHQRRGEIEKALEAYRNVIRSAPARPIGYVNLAGLLAHLRRFEEARAVYLDWIERRPRDAMAHYGLGHVLRELGDVEKAADRFRTATECDPRLAEAHSELGTALMMLGGRDEDAVRSFHRALDCKPDLVPALANLGELHRRRGEFEEAAKYLGRAASLQPANVPALLEYGRTLVAAGRPEEADACWSKVLESRPEDAGLLNRLAWMFAMHPDPRVRDPERAVELAQRAVGLAASETRFWNTLGAAQYRAGLYRDAVGSLDRAMRLGAGGNACDWLLAAMAFERLGKSEPARAWYRKAVAAIDRSEKVDEELERLRREAKETLKITASDG